MVSECGGDARIDLQKLPAGQRVKGGNWSVFALGRKGVQLVLGTAQLGMNYGIANAQGKPAFEEAFDIVNTAWNGGVRFFDTAQDYGESESILGQCLREIREKGSDDDPCIITKLRPDVDPRNTGAVLEELETSLDRLGVEKLWGFMLHREACLDIDKRELSIAIERIKEKGKTKHFGVSVYSPERAVMALDMDSLDMVQLPFNVFDQRALEEGIFDFAEKKLKTVFVRSVFLQGLLLLKPDQLPSNMTFCRDELKAFRSCVEKFSISPKMAALAFVVHQAPGAFLVLGAERAEQVRENLSLFRRAANMEIPDLMSLASQNPRVINPSIWN